MANGIRIETADGYGAIDDRTLQEALGNRVGKPDADGLIDARDGHETRRTATGVTLHCPMGLARRATGLGWRCDCGDWRIAWDGIIWGFRSPDDKAAAAALKAISEKAAAALGLTGWAAIDFLNGAECRRRGMERKPSARNRSREGWLAGWDWQAVREGAAATA